MTPRLVFAALCLTGTTGIVHADASSLARSLAATCANCHGTDGKSLAGMPRLAGEEKNTLLRKLRDFRSGTTPATIMQQISKGYTDDQLELIAAYFAAQK